MEQLPPDPAAATEPPCACPTPGFCDRYQMIQTPLAHARCRAADGDEVKSQAFRQKWRLRLLGPATKSFDPRHPNGRSPLKPQQGPRCGHRSEDPISAEASAKLGLSVIRTWFACAKGRGWNGHVCLCLNQCGPRCDDYQAPTLPTEEGVE